MVSYFLTVCGILSLVGFLLVRDKKSSILAIALKSLTSMFFIITAVFAVDLATPNSMKINSSLLVIVGLVFGLVGDIILDLKIYLKGRENLAPEFNKDKDLAMYTGMVAFGFGHIFYLSSIVMRYSSEWLHLVLSLVIGAVLMTSMVLGCEKFMKMNYGKFRIISIIYGTLLMGFTVYLIFINIKHPGINSVLLLLGSIMFLVSDLILSVTYFSNEADYKKEGIMNPESRFMIATNHATYYVAQFLIALSILFL